MDTPTLARMGIENRDQITRYETLQKSARKDVLRIFYKREPGSLLPVRRTYEFGRGLQSDVADSGEPRFEINYEVSPEYLSAVEELDALLENRNSRPARVTRVLEQLDDLQKRVDAGETGDDIGKRFGELRAELATLV